MTAMSRLSIRSLELGDIPFIVDYWSNASAAELERMGADPTKVPPPDQFTSNLKKLHATPNPDRKTSYLIWLVDGEAIGFSSLKNIQFRDRGEMHLHVWNPSFRGKGYGATLFCLSALEFYRRFELKEIHCEPRASNPFPNGMLRKIGFPLIKTHTAASSELSLVCELNRYAVLRDVAERYLEP